MISQEAVKRIIKESRLSIKSFECGTSYKSMKSYIQNMAESDCPIARTYKNMLDVLEAGERGEVLPIIGGNLAVGLAANVGEELMWDAIQWFRA